MQRFLHNHPFPTHPLPSGCTFYRFHLGGRHCSAFHRCCLIQSCSIHVPRGQQMNSESKAILLIADQVQCYALQNHC